MIKMIRKFQFYYYPITADTAAAAARSKHIYINSKI